MFAAKQAQAFINSSTNPVAMDVALIKHLARQKKLNDISDGDSMHEEDSLDSQDVNCCVVWARPPPSIISLIHTLQQEFISFLGTDFYAIPSKHLHLSVIELSHRHSVPQLRSVVQDIGTERIQSMLDILSTLDTKPGLTEPQVSSDKMGVAINFLPSTKDGYTYHHLRSDAHALALESGVSIDMCYTAPSAHITIGRFIGNVSFEKDGARSRFVELVERLNKELKNISKEKETWKIGSDAGLELQLGHVKFGRERAKAEMLGHF